MKRNAWKKFPWEEGDDQYQYPKTDKYQVSPNTYSSTSGTRTGTGNVDGAQCMEEVPLGRR